MTSCHTGMVTICSRCIISRDDLKDLNSINNLSQLHQTKRLRSLLSQHKPSEAVIKQLLRFEAEAHSHDKAKVLSCLKKNLDPEMVAKILHVLEEPTCKTLKQIILKMVDRIKARCASSNESSFVTKAWKFFVFTCRTFVLNVDLIKDIYLLVKLHSLLGGSEVIMKKPTIFQNTVSILNEWSSKRVC